MRILLIDDDKDDQTLFCEAAQLIAPGIKIELANDGREGLELLTSSGKRPEVVFLDINMPLLDGRETLNTIRSTSSLKDLQVVMYSTSINDDEKVKFRQLNARWIVKPNTFGALVELLTQELRSLYSDHNSRTHSLDRL